MNYQKIYSCDFANGSGVRVSLFVSGCNFHCKNCFNQESWNFSSGKPYTETTKEIILKELEQDYCTGLSILGGEPFQQKPEDLRLLYELAIKAKEKNKDIWIWSGYRWEELLKGTELQKLLLFSCDILVDGKFKESKKKPNLVFRGSSNQRIIDIHKSLEKKEIVLWKTN